MKSFTEKRKREVGWNQVGDYECFDRALTPLNTARVVADTNGTETAFATKEVTDAFRPPRISDEELVSLVKQGKCPVKAPLKIYRV